MRCQSYPYTDLDHTPTFDEPTEALDKLRKGKVVGRQESYQS